MDLEVQEQTLKYSSAFTSAKLSLLKQPQQGLTLCFLWHWVQGGNPTLITGDSGILVENNHLRQSAIFMGIQRLCPDWSCFESSPGCCSHCLWQGWAAPTGVSPEQQIPCCSPLQPSALCNRCWSQAVMLNNKHHTCPPWICLILFKPTYSFDLSKILWEGVPQYKRVVDKCLHFYSLMFSARNLVAAVCQGMTGHHAELSEAWAKKPQSNWCCALGDFTRIFLIPLVSWQRWNQAKNKVYKKEVSWPIFSVAHNELGTWHFLYLYRLCFQWRKKYLVG